MSDNVDKIDDLTKNLGNLKLADDLYPNFAAEAPRTVSELDALLIKKLQLIDKYTFISDSISDKFKEGFINISRANYAKADSLVKYGADYWDDRVKATKHVVVVDEEKFVLKNVEVEVEDPIKSETLRNRRPKKEESVKEAKKKQYNPINMFGVLVPYQLKAAQSEFSKSLNDIVSLANLIKEIDQLDRDIKVLEVPKEQTTE